MPDEPGGLTAGPHRSNRVWFAQLIRGPACLLVLFAHLGQVFPSDQATAASVGHFEPIAPPQVAWHGAIDLLARAHVGLGQVGVLLFFLVSGFVIPFSLEGRRLGRFVVRRFFRLYPTLWACLLLTAVVLAVQAQVRGVPFPLSAPDFGASGALLSIYLHKLWVEPVLWSLAIEELFYLVAALLAWRGMLDRPSAIAGVALGILATSVAAGSTSVGGPLFWLGFNATCVSFILVGVVLHHLYRQVWSPTESMVVAGVVLTSFLVGLHLGPMSSVASLYGPSSVVALVVFLALFAARDRIPYSALLDRVSAISYPLYLVHGVNGYVVVRAVYGATGNYYLAMASALAAAVVVAAVVHVLVEAPTAKIGRRLAPRHDPDAEPDDLEPVVMGFDELALAAEA